MMVCIPFSIHGWWLICYYEKFSWSPSVSIFKQKGNFSRTELGPCFKRRGFSIKFIIHEKSIILLWKSSFQNFNYLCDQSFYVWLRLWYKYASQFSSFERSLNTFLGVNFDQAQYVRPKLDICSQTKCKLFQQLTASYPKTATTQVTSLVASTRTTPTHQSVNIILGSTTHPTPTIKWALVLPKCSPFMF